MRGWVVPLSHFSKQFRSWVVDSLFIAEVLHENQKVEKVHYTLSFEIMALKPTMVYPLSYPGLKVHPQVRDNF